MVMRGVLYCCATTAAVLQRLVLVLALTLLYTLGQHSELLSNLAVAGIPIRNEKVLQLLFYATVSK